MNEKSIHQDVMINLPDDAEKRKQIPIMTGVLDYFPAALAEVAKISKKGNDQHNPGQRLHWAREKSTDQADTIIRHLIQRGTIDGDGTRHTAKAAWRVLALLQSELEREAGYDFEAPMNYAEDLLSRAGTIAKPNPPGFDNPPNEVGPCGPGGPKIMGIPEPPPERTFQQRVEEALRELEAKKIAREFHAPR